MHKFLLMICSILIFASVSSAQTATPRWELMGGYTTYLAGGEFSTAQPSGEPGQIPIEGFQVGLSRSIRSYFRVTSEFNGVFGKEALAVGHLPPGGEYKTGNQFLVLFGPEATIRTPKRVDFFAHYLIGLSRGQDNQVPPVSNNTFTSWIYAFGVGIDLKTSHRFAVRLLEADWVTSHFPKQDFDAEDNWRITTGLVFRFGH